MTDSKREFVNLDDKLLSDIETMGHSISEQEKRQILMEVLKKLC